MEFAHQEPQQYSCYTPPAPLSHSPYSTTVGATGFRPQERGHDLSSNSWNPSTAHYSSPNIDSGPINSSQARESSFSTGYYGSPSMSRADTVSKTTSASALGPSSGTYSGYDQALLNPTTCLGFEPRGSGIDSSHYRGGSRSSPSPSLSKGTSRSRYPCH